MVIHLAQELLDAGQIPVAGDDGELVAADAEHGAVLEDVADDAAGFPDQPVAGVVALGVVDGFQVVDIQNDHGKIGLLVGPDLGVQLFFRLHVGVLVLDAREGVDVRLALGPGQPLLIVMLLLHMGIDIVDAHDQALPVVLLHHGGLQPHIDGPALHDQAVAHGENAVLFNFREHRFLGEMGQEALQIVRIGEPGGAGPGGFEEVLPFLGQLVGPEFLGGAELPVMVVRRIHHVHAEEIAGEGVDPPVGGLLLPHPFRHLALLHLLVGVRDRQDDIFPVVLHAGDLQGHIHRALAFPVHFGGDPVGEDKGAVPVQSAHQRFAVHGGEEGGLILRMHIFFRVLADLLKEMAAPALFHQGAFFGVGQIFDEFLGFRVYIEQLHIAGGQGLGDAGVDELGIDGFLVGFLRGGVLPADAHHVRDIRAHAQDAEAPVGVRIFQLGGLELTGVARRVRHILGENVGLVHGEGHPVVLHEGPGRFGVKDLLVREADHFVGMSLLGIGGKGLVAGQVDAGFRVLGKAHGGHVVQQGGDGLLLLLAGFIHGVVGFGQEADFRRPLGGNLLLLPHEEHRLVQGTDHQQHGNDQHRHHDHDGENDQRHLAEEHAVQPADRGGPPGFELPGEGGQTGLHIAGNGFLLGAVGLVEHHGPGQGVLFRRGEGRVPLRELYAANDFRIAGQVFAAGFELQTHGVILPVHQRHRAAHGRHQRVVRRGFAHVLVNPVHRLIPLFGDVSFLKVAVQVHPVAGFHKAAHLLREAVGAVLELGGVPLPLDKMVADIPELRVAGMGQDRFHNQQRRNQQRQDGHDQAGSFGGQAPRFLLHDVFFPLPGRL